MKKALYTLITLLTLSIATQAQNVGVNTDGSDPDSDALLHVNRTTGVAIDSALIRIENEDNTTANHVTGLELINSATGPTSTWRFYNPGLGSTDLRINNNGNDYMTILNSGNVGIGTTAPSAKLDVHAPNNTYAFLATNSDEPGFGLYAKTLVTQPQSLYPTIPTESFRFGLKHNTNEDNGYISFYRGPTDAGGWLGLATNGTERMTIAPTGDVGIGTTTPSSLTEISSGTNGDAVLTISADTDNNDENDNPGIHLTQDGGAVTAYIGLEGNTPGTQGTNTTENALMVGTEQDHDVQILTNDIVRMTIDHTGNVGIGTATPSSNHVLSMFSSKATVGEVVGVKMSNANAVDLEIGVTGAAYTGVGQSNAGLINVVDLQPLIFGTNNTERMRILQTGNVGIGTITPGATLDVVGEIQFNTSNGLDIFESNVASRSFDFRGNTPANRILTVHPGPNAATGYGNVLVDFYGHDGTTTIPGFTMLRSGFVGIGTVAPGYNLDVVGDINYNGALTNVSDKRYKKDINKIDNALGLINQFDGYNYNFRVNEFPKQKFDSTAQIGFIAQEIKEVLPQLVSQNDSGYYSVDYIKVVPVLLMAIKEQQAIIEAQNAEIESLKTEASNATSTSAANAEKLKSLEAKINALLNAQAVTVQK
jgi:hypothetical protein